MSVSPKVLIVEDEPALLNALREKLTSLGYEVLAVDDGEKGLNVAKNAMPDCVILDLIMPRVGGIEMLKKLRASRGGETLPVIILTNVGNAEEIPDLQKDPHVWIFTKSDISLADLVVAIRGVITA